MTSTVETLPSLLISLRKSHGAAAVPTSSVPPKAWRSASVAQRGVLAPPAARRVGHDPLVERVGARASCGGGVSERVREPSPATSARTQACHSGAHRARPGSSPRAGARGRARTKRGAGGGR